MGSNGIHWAVILRYIQDHNLDVHEDTEWNVLHIYDLPTLQIMKGLVQQIGVRYLVLEGGSDRFLFNFVVFFIYIGCVITTTATVISGLINSSAVIGWGAWYPAMSARICSGCKYHKIVIFATKSRNYNQLKKSIGFVYWCINVSLLPVIR